jgi:Protein kinase domain
MPELPLVGDEFAGYRLRAVLGRGGMSVVYQAENPRLGNVIALKVLAPELATDDVFRTRFLEESRIAAAMNHPHVIPIHDMGSSDGLLYIAMRCVSGTDLRQMIKKRGRLQPDTAVFLLSQAARALDAAHRRGLVHRDVKPGNLLIERGNEDSDPDHLYLADFGITRVVGGRTGLTSTGQFLGTIDYVAPEQIRGLSVLGMADQYSLGCVLYECLTGRVPFEKDLNAAIIWAHVEEQPARPTLLRPDLPPAVDDLFARVLAKQPGERFENCHEFMTAARDALGTMAASPAADGGLRAVRAAPLPAPPGGYREVAHDPAAELHEMTASIVPPGLRPPQSRPASALDGAPGSGGGRHRPGRGRRRGSLLVLAAAFVLTAGIGITVGAWVGFPGRAGSSQQPGVSASTAGAALTPATLPVAPQKTLRQALALLNATVWTTGFLPPKSCTFLSAVSAKCSQPYPGITVAFFQNYSSPDALYQAYEAAIKQANNGHFLVNVQDCGASAPPPGGAELSWNHFGRHTRAYSIQQLETGKLSAASQAAGRMFCNYDSSTNTEDIIWTETDGNMLGEVTGSPHLAVWGWWLHVHHNIAFNGEPMGAMNTAPSPFPAA